MIDFRANCRYYDGRNETKISQHHLKDLFMMWNKKKVKMLFNYSNGILFKKVSQSLSWCAKDDWERLKMKYASFFVIYSSIGETLWGTSRSTTSGCYINWSKLNWLSPIGSSIDSSLSSAIGHNYSANGWAFRLEARPSCIFFATSIRAKLVNLRN